MLRMIATPKEILRSLVKHMSDLWRGIVSRKSHVSKLKQWMRKHSKKNNKKKLKKKKKLSFFK